MQLTAISTRVPGAALERRRFEPMTVGVPLAPGTISDGSELALIDGEGHEVPIQVAVLQRWPADGSVRWGLLDARLNVPTTYQLIRRSTAPRPIDGPLLATKTERGWRVATGAASFEIQQDAEEIFVTASDGRPTQSVVLLIEGSDGVPRPVRFRSAVLDTAGHIRTAFRLEGEAAFPAAPALRITARVTFFRGLAAARVELTVLNPQRAEHPGGQWELGDGGSVFLRDVSIVVGTTGAGVATCFSEGPASTDVEIHGPALLYQESSGGDNWASPTHVNRQGEIPVRYRGYELRGAAETRTGLRATPSVWRVGEHPTAVTVRDFWQNFPKCIEATSTSFRIGLFPREAADLHELQGGEQKTHVVGIGFEHDGVALRALDWISRPAVATATPEYYVGALAAPYLCSSADGDVRYERVVAGAIEGPDAFERKREQIDEYGWRHFGDIYADHEVPLGGHAGGLVSHYNNQYDGLNGFALQYLRSGDTRWWVAMNELARHVVDIDIYHTERDKAAFNGGLFWHTFHYTDAGRSAHRSYPRTGAAGGGPSNEHNYSTGLMNYFFITGEPWARDAAVGLADWVIAMEDGNRTVFRWLSRGSTGLSSATASPSYHGPGRGAGNSIVTLLNGFRLTSDVRYLRQAERLIRRCIHPADDVAQRRLLDIELRWSYTVFLQALGRYLDEKLAAGERDAMYTYARESLLHYARWMRTHEYPYLEKPDLLEYPTETWAAQDMRKSEVFLHAARHASPAEQDEFRERAAFFYEASLDWLHRFESRALTRPRVLMLSYGFMFSTAARGGGLPAAAVPMEPLPAGEPETFIPQKAVAFRRAKGLVALFCVAVVALLVAAAIALT